MVGDRLPEISKKKKKIDGIYSEGRPEGRPSAWESEGRSDAQHWLGSGCPEAATVAATADVGASAIDGIYSEGRPEGRLSAWEPEAAIDGIYVPGLIFFQKLVHL